MRGEPPVLIPVITDLKALTVLVSELDGLVMSGGGDINPLYLHEEPIPQLQDVDTLRDEYDLILLRLAANRQIPIMGICRGHQIMNVAFGGSVYQTSITASCSIETQPDIGSGISVAYGNTRTGNEPPTYYFQWR